MSDIDAEPARAESAPAVPSVRGIIPGVALCGAIAAAAFALRLVPGVAVLSPMILSIMLGIGYHNIARTPLAAKPGIVFSLRRILRFAIVLLGFQLTVQQVEGVGLAGFAVLSISLAATFLFSKWVGAALGVDRRLAELIAAGTSICGASAVIATNTVTRAPDEDAAYAVVCVTLFGTVAMFLYPLLPGLLHLADREYGLWTGASVHEVAQVVAAAYQHGKASGDYAAITKLTRVMLLAPMVIGLGLWAARGETREKGAAARAPMPYFVLGFIAAMLINTMMPIPAEPKTLVIAGTNFLLALAGAAMGLETDIGKLKAKGVRPLLLGGASTLFIAGLSLILVKLAV
jgi:uncharacterized integral membrane protein (TIGR00698 family)